MELSLSQLFGEGASQTETHLIINKSALRGLTTSSNNRAEQLLAAIVFTAEKNFKGKVSSESGIDVASEQGKVLTYDNSPFYDYLLIEQWGTVLDKGSIIFTFLISSFKEE
jgi:hypothetical protein